MQEKEDLAAQLQQVRDEVVDMRQQLKAAFEEQKQAEATRDEAEMRVLEVLTYIPYTRGKTVRGGGRVHHSGGGGMRKEGWQHRMHTRNM